MAIYPPDPETFGLVHIGFEYIYEYIRGARLVDEDRLNSCETIVSTFFEDLQNAAKYFEYGITINSFPH